MFFFFFSSRRRHTRWPRDWSSDVCSSDLFSSVEQSSPLQLTSAGIRYYKLANQTVVNAVQFKPVYPVAFQEHGIARIGDLHLLHHCAHNNFTVLVIDFHTLQTVYFLNFIHQVALYSKWAENVQDLLCRYGTVRKGLSCFHKVIFLYKDVLGKGDQIPLLICAIFTFDNHFLRTALSASHLNDTVQFGYSSRITW